MARSWSSDAQVLRLISLHINEAPDGPPGAAAAWQATFTSASKGRARGYTFSIVESEGNLHKGAFAGPEQSWSGPQGVTTPFLALAVKVDTDAAYKTAMTTPQSKAAEYDKKNPGKPDAARRHICGHVVLPRMARQILTPCSSRRGQPCHGDTL